MGGGLFDEAVRACRMESADLSDGNCGFANASDGICAFADGSDGICAFANLSDGICGFVGASDGICRFVSVGVANRAISSETDDASCKSANLPGAGC